jgi:hypothetical protein
VGKQFCEESRPENDHSIRENQLNSCSHSRYSQSLIVVAVDVAPMLEGETTQTMKPNAANEKAPVKQGLSEVARPGFEPDFVALVKGWS